VKLQGVIPHVIWRRRSYVSHKPRYLYRIVETYLTTSMLVRLARSPYQMPYDHLYNSVKLNLNLLDMDK